MIEILLLVIFFLIIGGCTFSLLIMEPHKPSTFPYAIEYPKDLVLSETNLNSIKIKSDLFEYNKSWYPVFGIYISEDQSQCRPDCNPLEYTIELTTTYGQLHIDSPDPFFNISSGFSKDGKSFMLTFKGSLEKVNDAFGTL